MAGITRAALHLSAEELTMKWKLDPHSWRRPRWLIISHALVDPREATEKARAYRHDGRHGASGDCQLRSRGCGGGRN